MRKIRIAGCLLAAALMICGLLACKDGNDEEMAGQAGEGDYLASQNLSEADRKKVLVLHSYHPEYIWVQDLNEGISRGLREERFYDGKNVTVAYFYMDTKRKPDEAWKKKAANQAIRKISEMQPDVVIATDDNAQQYVVRKMKDSSTAFVFAGVNADPRKYGYVESFENPGHNVTGSIERARFEQSLDLLRRVVGPVKKIAIICDGSPTGEPILPRVRQKAADLDVEIVAARQTNSFPEWKKFVRDQQNRADALLVIVYHTLKDAQGRHVTADKVLHWTIQNNDLPDFGFWAWAVEGGLLCSEAISGYQQGYYASTVASYILRGQAPGDFAVDMPQRGEPCLNVARAEMLGLKLSPDMLNSATCYQSIDSAR